MHSDNLCTFRGKIQVSKQLQHNICHPEKLFCDFEEFQEDNALNHILKAGLTIASRHAHSPGTRVSVQALLDLFVDITDVPTSKLQWSGLEQDRRYTGWKSALFQARWFIEGECPNIYSGKNDSISILFDMAKLFERYVAIEVGNIISPEGYSIQCQGPPAWLLSGNDTLCYKTIPDIFITKDDHPIAILDTKWKFPKDGSEGFRISQCDLYQLFTYAGAYHVNDVALIYPSCYGETFEYRHWKYMDNTTSLHIIHVDIATLSRSRQEFRDELSRAGLSRVITHADLGGAKRFI
jgi:5-methylcytosine-specific restriction enzyme subunit McrC